MYLQSQYIILILLIWIFTTRKTASALFGMPAKLANAIKHDGITFDQAAEAFFDPFLKLVDAGRNHESRDAVIGYDEKGRLLFVVHIEVEGEFIRLISARKATLTERNAYDF
ncbi:protein of unknown function DUF497 [Methylobacter tundripaludum SV96]|uniref:BrnT family toxin n=2 Tax=Methylobacter tundripaludum TaxID=173365 RepID=G3IXG4_METTV|nr:protein of unknown function DUF497 [Methylobacter tundripaludum SV96]